MIRHYRLFGLGLASDLELPELADQPQPPGTQTPDVHIRRAPVPAPPEGSTAGYIPGPEGTLLNVPEVGRFMIRGGAEILVEPAAGASARNVRLYIIGSAMGALLHQRGLLPLHANAVVLGEGEGAGVVAFSGPSGAGKSTLAAWFHDRGHPLLADDVCAVEPAGEAALVHPGPPRIRLWREALEASGRMVEGHSRSFDALDKYDVPATGAAPPQTALPLRAFYLLARAEEGAPSAIEPVLGATALGAFVTNTYRGGYIRLAGDSAAHFARCREIARRVPVYAVRRAWGLERLDEEAERLRAHALGMVAK